MLPLGLFPDHDRMEARVPGDRLSQEIRGEPDWHVRRLVVDDGVGHRHRTLVEKDTVGRRPIQLVDVEVDRRDRHCDLNLLGLNGCLEHPTPLGRRTRLRRRCDVHPVLRAIPL